MVSSFFRSALYPEIGYQPLLLVSSSVFLLFLVLTDDAHLVLFLLPH